MIQEREFTCAFCNTKRSNDDLADRTDRKEILYCTQCVKQMSVNPLIYELRIDDGDTAKLTRMIGVLTYRHPTKTFQLLPTSMIPDTNGSETSKTMVLKTVLAVA